MLDDPFAGVMVLLALILIGWALFDLKTGVATTLPGRFMPAMEFTHEDDGLIFYMIPAGKFIAAFSMVAHGFGLL